MERKRLPFVVTMSMLQTVNDHAIRLDSPAGVARYFVDVFVVVRRGMVAA